MAIPAPARSADPIKVAPLRSGKVLQRSKNRFEMTMDLKERFSGAVESVELHRCRFSDKTDKIDGGGFSLNVAFDRSGHYPRVVAEAEGDHARERVGWFISGILEVVEPHRTYGFVYRFHPVIDGALWVLPFPLAAAACLPGAPSLLAKLVACGAVAFGLHRIGALMIPYSASSSRSVEIRAKIWRWVLTGTAGAVLFGVVLSTVLRKALGF